MSQSTLPIEKITLRYEIIALLFLAVAGIEGMMMRVELDNIPLLSYDHYFAVMTAHPIVGIYGWAYLAVMGAFYYLVPKLLNKELYSKKIAMIGLWMQTAGVIIAWSAGFFFRYGALYTLYWPLPVAWNRFEPIGALTYSVGVALIEISVLLFIFNIFATIFSHKRREQKVIRNFLIAAFGIDALLGLLNHIRHTKRLSNMDGAGADPPPPVFIVSVMRGSIDAVINSIVLIVAGLIILIYSISAIMGTYLNPQFVDPLIYKNWYWWGLDMIADGDVLIWTAGTLYLLAPLLANRALYGERVVRYVILADLIVSMGVWSHHLLSDRPQPAMLRLVSGQFITWGEFFTMGLSFFTALITLWFGRPIKSSMSLKFMLGAIFGFALGGFAGLVQANYGLNVIIHNTQWIAGIHIHMMLLAGLSSLIFAVIYTLLPMLTGRGLISEKLSNLHFWLWMIGSVGMAISVGLAGTAGMLRRDLYFGTSMYLPYMYIGTAFAIIMAIGYLVFIINIIKTYGLKTLVGIFIPLKQ
ncbi:MAG: cbb3-type cytochrome c oxidase subunit I [Thermoprotei archaeon]